MTASGRIIANTIASYCRLFLSGLVGLFLTPLALHTLGAVDYGIFAVVGGSMTFLSFINNALTQGAQRHIAFALGAEDLDDARKWLSTSLAVHVALALVLLAGALIAERPILYHLLHLPAARLEAGVWVYRIAALTMVINILCTPYQAAMMARESIVAVSAISVGGIVLMGVGIILLPHFPGDLLLWYAALYAGGQNINSLGGLVYGYVCYPECRNLSLRRTGRSALVELLGFSGWNLFGSLSGVVRAQGPAILLNIFSGTIANAAYGLALQVNGFSSNISGAVLRATSSPIVKLQARGDRDRVGLLSNLSSIYSFSILWMVLAPVLVERDTCLRLWLHSAPPPNTGTFMTLLLVALLIDQLTFGFIALAQAVGRIAVYQFVVGSLNCIAVPIGYLLLRGGASPSAVLWACLGGAVIAGISRIFFARSLGGVQPAAWSRQVLLPAALSVFGTFLSWALVHNFPPGLLRVVLFGMTNALACAAVLWMCALLPEHKKKLSTKLGQLLALAGGRRAHSL